MSKNSLGTGNHSRGYRLNLCHGSTSDLHRAKQPGLGDIKLPGIPFGMLFRPSLDHTGSEAQWNTEESFVGIQLDPPDLTARLADGALGHFPWVWIWLRSF